MFKYIDLFAGIGGFRLGLSRHWAECVFTSEIDPVARMCYAGNYGMPEHSIAGDIAQIDPADIPKHDMLCAGFPCQAFSRAGNRHGFDDDRGTMFFHISRILKVRRPASILLENVPLLRTHDQGRTFKIIISELQSIGYKLSWNVLAAQSWLPQIRRRLFITGHLHRDYGLDFMRFRNPNSGPKLKTILEEKPDCRFTLTDSEWKKIQSATEENKKNGIKFIHRIYGPNDVAQALVASYGQPRVAAQILIENGSDNPRRLTIREATRLMGFPDWFRLPDNMVDAYRLLGNAVCPPVVDAIIEHLGEPVCPLKKKVA